MRKIPALLRCAIGPRFGDFTPYDFTPFGRNGKLAIVTTSDPRWLQRLSKILHQPVWHNIGAIKEN